LLSAGLDLFGGIIPCLEGRPFENRKYGETRTWESNLGDGRGHLFKDPILQSLNTPCRTRVLAEQRTPGIGESERGVLTSWKGEGVDRGGLYLMRKNDSISKGAPHCRRASHVLLPEQN